MIQAERVLACLTKSAEPFAKEFPNLATVKGEMERSHDPFLSRIEDMDRALHTLNGMLHSEKPLDDRYKNVIELQTRLSEHSYRDGTVPHFITFKELRKTVEATDKNVLHQQPIHNNVIRTLAFIRKYIRDNQWNFPTQITDNPTQVFAGMIIEGYGELVSQQFNDRSLARPTVLAIEEVLWDSYRDSDLLHDVLPWMKEEQSDFSKAFQKEFAA